MLQKNKIFLSLLGSFYDDTAYTDFSSRLDYIYTSIIFNRYAHTLRRAVMSTGGSSIPDSINFGFINSTDIDVPNKSVTVRDINNSVVEDINILSFMYLDVEEFFSVTDGVVSDSGWQKVTSLAADIIPVLYMTNVSREMCRNGIFRFVEKMEDSDFTKIKDASLRIVSDQLIYFPETIKLLHKLSNILLGAIYSLNNETVLEVRSNIVVTTSNTYNITDQNEGRIVVSVGDVLSPSDLITSLAIVNTDVAFITDVSRMESYINFANPSFSNTVFLRKISSAVAKKKAAIVIPPDVFSSTSKEVISAINSIFKLSSVVDTHTTSGVQDGEIISGSSTSLVILDTYAICDILMAGAWDLTISDNSGAQVESDDSIIFEESMSPFVMQDMVLGIEPVLDSSIATFTDDIVNKYEGLSTIQGSEFDSKAGLYIETSIATTLEEEAVIFEGLSTADLSDGGGEYKDITVSTNDAMSIHESDTRMVSAKDAAIMALGDVLSLISKEIEYVSLDSGLSGDIEQFDASSIGISGDLLFIESDSSTVFPAEEDTDSNISIKTHDFFTSSEQIITSADIKVTTEVEILAVESSIMTVKNSIILSDESDVESENNIDL